MVYQQCKSRCDELKPPTLTTGHVRPKYAVVGVMYAPPGSANAASTNSIVYKNSFQVGTTITATTSISCDRKVTLGVSDITDTNGVTLSVGHNTTNSDQCSTDIRVGNTEQITIPGPMTDSIDHDSDIILLWLNPQVNVATNNGKDLLLSLAVNGDFPLVFPVTVGDLKHPSQNLIERLMEYDITQDEYEQIQKYDPFFAYGTVQVDPETLDPRRFIDTGPLPYAHNTTQERTFTYTAMRSTQNTVMESHSVGISSKLGAVLLPDLLKGSVAVDGTWTWTHTNENTRSTTTTDEVTYTIGGPSAGCKDCPLFIEVYKDTLYNTFLFRFRSPPNKVTVTGNVSDLKGTPLQFQEVFLTINGLSYRTFTNVAGTYVFDDAIPDGIAQLVVGSVTQSITVGPTLVKQDFVLGKAVITFADGTVAVGNNVYQVSRSPLTLSGTSSTGTSTLRYSWASNLPVAFLDTGIPGVVNVQFSGSGGYLIQLTVTDNLGNTNSVSLPIQYIGR